MAEGFPSPSGGMLSPGGGMPSLQLPRDVAAAVGSADMSDVTPAAYLADIVVVVSDAATGEPGALPPFC
jgi:hypothetical protein